MIARKCDACVKSGRLSLIGLCEMGPKICGMIPAYKEKRSGREGRPAQGGKNVVGIIPGQGRRPTIDDAPPAGLLLKKRPALARTSAMNSEEPSDEPGLAGLPIKTLTWSRVPRLDFQAAGIATSKG